MLIILDVIKCLYKFLPMLLAVGHVQAKSKVKRPIIMFKFSPFCGWYAVVLVFHAKILSKRNKEYGDKLSADAGQNNIWYSV